MEGGREGKCEIEGEGKKGGLEVEKGEGREEGGSTCEVMSKGGKESEVGRGN